jgi:hypothetical protein
MVLNELPPEKQAQANMLPNPLMDENALKAFINTNDIDEAQAKAKAIVKLSNPGKTKDDSSLNLLSKTNSMETFYLSSADTQAKVLGLKAMQWWHDSYMEHLVSENGLGRKQIMQVARPSDIDGKIGLLKRMGLG